MSEKKAPHWTRYLIIPALVLFIIIMGRRELAHLRDYKIMTTGICTKIEPYRGGWGLSVHFEFVTHQNETRKSKYRLYVPKRYKDNLVPLMINKIFPVIYDSTKISRNAILVLREDYVRYDCPMPDSLLPVIYYVDSLSKN